MKENNLRAIKSLLTEENFKRVKSRDWLNLALHLYHKTGRDKKKLNETVDLFFKERSEEIEATDDIIKSLKREIELRKEILKGIFQDDLTQPYRLIGE